MSKDQARSFFSRLHSDKDLAEKVREAYVNSVCEIARSEGFDVSPEDMQAIASSADFSGDSDELHVEDLEQVMGGAGGVPDEVARWIYEQVFNNPLISPSTTNEEFVEIYNSLPQMLPVELRQVAQSIVNNLIRNQAFRPVTLTVNTEN